MLKAAVLVWMAGLDQCVISMMAHVKVPYVVYVLIP